MTADRQLTIRMDEDTYQQLRRVAYESESSLNVAAVRILQERFDQLTSEIPGSQPMKTASEVRSRRSLNRKKKKR